MPGERDLVRARYCGREVSGMILGRPAIVSIVAAMLLLAALVAGTAASEAYSVHPVEGRFSVTSDAGGAVWAFQAGGSLIVVGPGEIVSEGSWRAADGEREFDAELDVAITGQQLVVLGEAAPNGSSIAMYVTASEAADPTAWTPWPAESRLVGERFGMAPDETPAPSMSPQDCARPLWFEGAVDWDRCDTTGLTEA